MNVSICESPERWDAFVSSMPEASNYHRWVWRRVIEQTFGHQGYYLAAGNGTIDGVLPLIFMESRLFGKFLVSMPFFSYGGVLASSNEARASLLSTAIELARELRARHIELRQGARCETHLVGYTPKVTMEVDLPANVDHLWARFSPKLRKRIRAGRKRGLRAEWNGTRALDNFYRVFAENMRNLGTPVYPIDWFRNIQRNQPDATRILILHKESRPVAAAFLIRHGSVLELPWAASTRDRGDDFASRVLYCTLLEYAVENGFRSVDLGRCTPGGGNHQFKQYWGARERSLNWYYWLPANSRLPELRSDNPRYAWATRSWKLLPLGVANLLGPKIVRAIP